MKQYIPILSIAGSDCSGGAGIQADIKTISSLGGYAATAITAITVQNTLGVKAIQAISSDIIEGQIETVISDIKPLAIKIGMINNKSTIITITKVLQKYSPKYVILDPVMVSTSGSRLLEDDAIEILKNKLFPLSYIITPNLQEAEVLLNRQIKNIDEMKEAAMQLSKAYNKNILLKGGHLNGENMCDILFDKENGSTIIFEGKKIDSNNTHGTGCSLSSAIATFIARGYSLKDSIKNAKEYVNKGIEYGKDVTIGEGKGPINHFYEPIRMIIKEL